jgi:hypothetical protein
LKAAREKNDLSYAEKLYSKWLISYQKQWDRKKSSGIIFRELKEKTVK